METPFDSLGAARLPHVTCGYGKLALVLPQSSPEERIYPDRTPSVAQLHVEGHHKA